MCAEPKNGDFMEDWLTIIMHIVNRHCAIDEIQRVKDMLDDYVVAYLPVPFITRIVGVWSTPDYLCLTPPVLLMRPVVHADLHYRDLQECQLWLKPSQTRSNDSSNFINLHDFAAFFDEQQCRFPRLPRDVAELTQGDYHLGFRHHSITQVRGVCLQPHLIARVESRAAVLRPSASIRRPLSGAVHGPR